MNNPLNMIDPTGLDFEGDGGDGGDPGIGDGCDFCEAPPVGGPTLPGYSSSHTPFPVPGQGIDWLNWLFGPACTGGPIGNPCVITNITSTACDPSAADCGVTKNCNDDGSGCVLQITVNFPSPSDVQNRPINRSCLAKAAGSALLHGSIDALGMVPLLGDLSATVSGTASALANDYSDSTGTALTGAGILIGSTDTVLKGIGTASKFAEAVPIVGTVAGVFSLAYDGYAAYKQYNACAEKQ